MTTHLTEDDLVLHYYGEMSDAEESRSNAHLSQCAECHESYRRLQRVLAAVDETALAADSMSSTIAAIRSDTEQVAKDIDQVEQGFGRFSTRISDFRSATSEFVSSFAA